GQLQRREPRIDVEPVADLTLRLDPAAAQRQRKLALVAGRAPGRRRAMHREPAATVECAPAQSAAEVGYVDRDVQAAVGAGASGGRDIAVDRAIPAAGEIAR